MQGFVKNYIAALKSDRRRRRKAYIALAFMSVLVAGLVFWQLSMPGETMTTTLTCELAEHTHTQGCYQTTITCTQDHEHTDECSSMVLGCAQPEHTHDGSCYSVSLEDEAADWDISAHFVESTIAEDGTNVAWIEKDTEEWNAGPVVTENEDGKTIVDPSGDYRVDKTKANGNNKSVTVRVRFKYSGDIERFAERELKLEIPNLMYGCGSQQFYATEVKLNAESLFRFEDGSVSIAGKYNYYGKLDNKETIISATETLILTNYKAVDDAKELQGYFDVTYELASGKEHDKGWCELTATEFADECTHSHVSYLNSIRFLRRIPVEFSQSESEYGFVGNYSAGTENSGLRLDFVRRYIHPWCRPALAISKSHENSVPNYGAKKTIAEQKDDLTVEEITTDYSWLLWDITAYKGWRYGGVNLEESEYNSRTEWQMTYVLLDGHKPYYYMSNDKLYVFSGQQLTSGGNFELRVNVYIQEAFPKDCIVALETGELLEPSKDANGVPLEDENGNYIYKIALSDCTKIANTSYKYKKLLFVGYPKDNYVYNKDGTAKSKDEREITNTVTLKALGADGVDYSKTDSRVAELPVDQSGGSGAGFSYEFSKRGKTGKQNDNTLNGMLSSGVSTAPFWITMRLDNVPAVDGVDVEITDEDIGIKKLKDNQELTELTKDERRISQLNIPQFKDKYGAAVYADVTVELSYADGSVITETYKNTEKSWSKVWYNVNDMPCGFKIVLSDVHDDIATTEIYFRAGLVYSDSVVDKLNNLNEIGVRLTTADGDLYVTNSARISVKNHKTGDYYTSGMQDSEYYRNSNLEPTYNGWHYYDVDTAKVENGEEVNYIRVYGNTIMHFINLQKYTYMQKLCTDDFSNARDGYYYNTYSLRWIGTNGPSSGIGESVPLYAGYYKSEFWDNLWENYITAKDSTGEYINKGIIYQKVTMLDIMPAGLEITCTEEDIKNSAAFAFTDDFYKAFRVSDGSEISREEIAELIKSSINVEFTENYDDTGRTLITISFDVGKDNAFVIVTTRNGGYYTSDPVITLNLDIDWRIGFDNILKYGYQNKNITNNVTFTRTETGNRVIRANDPDLSTGTMNEVLENGMRFGMASHSCSITYAGAMTQGILDQVRTSQLSTYLPDNAESARRTALGKDYSYQVRFAVLDSKVTNVKFSNTLECNADDSEYGADEWSGTLSYIDMSEYKSVIGSQSPTAEFTDAKTGTSTALIWDPAAFKFTVPDGETLTSGTITVSLGNAKLEPEKYYSYYIHMTAPAEHQDGLTSNKSFVEYQKLNNEIMDIDVYKLVANRVYVKLAYPTDTTELEVRKVWDIKGQESITLPERINFSVLQNDKVFKTGTLTAADEWKAIVTGLPVYDQESGEQYTYTVRESSVEGYTTSVKLLEQTSEDGLPVWQITNTLIGYDYDIKVVKTDNIGNKLSGVGFELQNADGETLITGLTDENGELILSQPTKLIVGNTYRLIETKTPDGYTPLSSEAIVFSVNSEGEPVTVDYDENDNIACTWNSDDDSLVITVENAVHYELPASGGAGVHPFVIGGLLIMAAPLIYIYVRRKERRSEN